MKDSPKTTSVKLDLIHRRLESLVKTTAKRDAKIMVGDMWKYDLSNNTIYYPLDGDYGVKNLAKDRFIGTTFHEISHSLFTDGVAITNPTKYQKEYGFLLNSLEDARIENMLMNRFAGTYDSFKRMHEFSDEIIQEKDLKEMPAHHNLLMNFSRFIWGHTTHPLNKDVEDVLKVFKEFTYDIYVSETTEDLKQLIDNELFPLFEKLLEQSEEEKNNQQNQNNSDPNQPPTSKNPSKDYENATSIKDLVEKIEKNTSKKDIKKAEKKSGIDKESFTDKTIEELQKDVDPKTVKEIALKIDGDLKKYQEYYNKIKESIDFFSLKLGSILRDNNYRRFGGNFKTGKLNSKSLYKFKCKQFNIFKKRVMRQHKNYSVTLLVDQSGSMAVSRIEHALLSTILMAEVLKKIGVDFEIKGFNLERKLYKSFDQSYSDDIKRGLVNMRNGPFGPGSGGNNDGYEIYKSTQSLLKRDSEKILIALSDGLPNPKGTLIPESGRSLYKQYYSDFKLGEEVEKAGKQVICIGIGIESDAVKKFYPQSEVCNNIKELPELLLKRLRMNIHRG